jgi:hypothetical protein
VHLERTRKVGSRKPRNVVLVVMEGETERRYFDGLKERDSNIRIVLVKPGPADPVHLVKACIQNMEERGIDVDDGDLAICVFDVDENPPGRIVQAAELARERGIMIALTNPCFEIWLALHYQEVHRPVDRREACALIKKHYPKYSKTGDLGPVLVHREAATRRSRNIMDQVGASGIVDLIEHDPSSSMHLVLEAIEQLKEKNSDKRASCH